MQGILFNLLNDMHEKRFIEDSEIQYKADVFYAFNRLTEEEYIELCSILKNKL